MRKVYQLKNDTELKDLKNILKSVILSRFQVPGSKRARDLGLTRLAKNIENDEKVENFDGSPNSSVVVPRRPPNLQNIENDQKMTRRA